MNRKITGTCTFVAFLMLGYLGLIACDAPTPSSTKSGTSLGAADALPADCNEEAKEDGAAAFRLVGAEKANYDADVGTLITGKCATAGCHQAGGPNPDLSDYEKAKAAGVDILDRAVVQANMPNQNGGGPLQDAEKELLQEWADLGYPKLYIAPPAEDDPEEAAPAEEKDDFAAVADAVASCTGCHNSASSTAGVDLESREGFVASMDKIFPRIERGGDDHHVLDDVQKETIQTFMTAASEASTADNKDVDECKTPVAGKAITESKFSKALTPAKMTECKEAGNLYDRAAKDCHTASSGSKFNCDWDGVGRAYRNTGAEENLLSLKEDGFQVDQCGMDGKSPVFMLIKMDDVDKDMEFEYKILSLSR